MHMCACTCVLAYFFSTISCLFLARLGEHDERRRKAAGGTGKDKKAGTARTGGRGLLRNGQLGQEREGGVQRVGEMGVILCNKQMALQYFSAKVREGQKEVGKLNISQSDM